MIQEIKLPEVAENVHSVVLVDIRVKQGDKIEKDQIIFSVETDKATIEIPSSFAGLIKEIKSNSGDTVDVGAVVMLIETEAEAEVVADTKVSTEKENTDTKNNPIEKNEEQVTEKRRIEQFDKLTVSLAEIKEAEVTSEKEVKEISEKEKSVVTDVIKKEVPASPSVRKLAREIGVNIYEVIGTGPAGRISEIDVKQHAKNIIIQQQESLISSIDIALPDFSKWGEIEKKPMSRVREITAQKMLHSWQTIPHVFQFENADITNLESFRKKHEVHAEKKGGKLTMTTLLVKLMAEALKHFPMFNVSVDMNNKELIHKKYIHIGIAVDTDRGLLVPVIKNADKKSIIEIAVELTELAGKTRDKKITPDEMEGGTFTISNLGGIGGSNFTPIIYSPQVAILGVSKASMQAVWFEKKFKPRLILPLTLSYDHRAIDGADAARLMNWLCEVMDNPLEILL